MRLRNDDDLARVDNEYLGPPGSDWPRARYIAYVVAAGVLLGLMGVEHRIGMKVTAISMIYTLVATVLITRAVGKRITHEVPFRVLPAVLWRELTSPRALTYSRDNTFCPGRVPVRDTVPARRRWRRG